MARIRAVIDRIAAATLCAILLCPAIPAQASENARAVPERFRIGADATAADIAARDINVMPDGEGLPEGSGTVDEGRKIYEKACLQCHGVEGQGGSAAALAGGETVEPASMAADRAVTHTIGNYWPWATTLFDYTRRAMPYDRPGSLANDEVYAVTVYMLYLNELVGPDTRLDAASLPRVRMPAARFFRPDGRDGEPES